MMTTDQIPWSTRLFLAACSLALDACSRFDLFRRLSLLFDTNSPPSSTKGVASSDVTVDPSRNLWFRLYFPSSSSSTLPLLIFFHGGGFVFGSPSTAIYDNLCRRLAHDLPAVVVSVNYRLAPDHRYPCQYDDGLDVLKFIDAQNRAVLPSSADLSRCFVAGDSAGGNIAHHVTLRACDHAFEKVKIIGVVAIQPFFGGAERTESELRLEGAPILNTRRTDWMWRSFLPKGSSRDHEAANVSGEITAAKFPATVVFVGGLDPLQGLQRRYCEGLRKSGKEVELVEYPDAIHGFCTFPVFPHFGYAIGTLREFIQKQSAASK